MKKYTTQNLYEASFLLSKSFELLSRDSSGQKVSLTFKDSPELNQAVMDYYNGKGEVNAKSFVDFYRHLKDWIFQR